MTADLVEIMFKDFSAPKNLNIELMQIFINSIQQIYLKKINRKILSQF